MSKADLFWARFVYQLQYIADRLCHVHLGRRTEGVEKGRESGGIFFQRKRVKEAQRETHPQGQKDRVKTLLTG